ncbi:34654_t:CDS:1, partial [Gigaspora margarita]
MPFMLNANNGWSDCSIVGINAQVLNVIWGPDPVGPTGTIIQFNVSQELSNATTTFTKIVIAFIEPNGVISSSILFEIPPGITSIDKSFPVVIPDFIPAPQYTVSAMITE